MDKDQFGGLPVNTDSFGGVLADAPPPRKRTLAAIANDTVIEAANAAAGGVSAAANFIKPGNAFSNAIDKNIIQAGEANQSDVTKAAKQTFRQDVAQADGVGDELGAVGRYVVDNPVLSAAQAVGSFVGPGAATAGGRTLAGIARLGERGVVRGGLAGGAAAGAAMAGGDAAGTAYDLASKAGATEEQAVQAGRNASVIPAMIGGASGMVGAERLFAGGKGFAGNAASRAIKTGLVEGGGEAVEEGVTQYEGQRAAMPYDKTIDPTKGVAAAAGMGAALGGITGAGTSLLTGGHGSQAGQPAPTPGGQQLNPADDPSVGSTAAPAPVAPAVPAIDPTAGPLSKAAAMAGNLQLTPTPAPTPAPAAAAPAALAPDVLSARIDMLAPEQRQEARYSEQQLQRADLPAGVRAFHENQLRTLTQRPEELNAEPIAPVGQQPVGEVVPGFDARQPAESLPNWVTQYQDQQLQGEQYPELVDSLNRLPAEAKLAMDYYRSGQWDALKERFHTSGGPRQDEAELDAAFATLDAADRSITPAQRVEALRTIYDSMDDELGDFGTDLQLDAPAPRLGLVPNQPASYEGGIDFEPTPSAGIGRPPAAAPGAVQQAIARLALAADITPGAALPLNLAHRLRREAAAEGFTLSVVPHPSGRGYDVAPTARLDPAARAAMPQDEGAASLPFDSSTTGRMVAGQQGVRTEARAEAVARANEQQQARMAEEAERQRRADLGLSSTSPVTPNTDTGNPVSPVSNAGNPALTFDTGPTGRMVAGADGAQQTQQPQENASAPQANQAQQAQSQQPQAPAAPAPAVEARNPTWRRNAMAANKVARGLGIDPKGKTLAQVVGEIDARDAQAGGARPAVQEGAGMQGLQPTTAAQLDTPAQGVLANATAQKRAAFERVKTLRAQVKGGRSDLQVQLIRAEDAHREALRNEQGARGQLEREANRQGQTLQRGTTTAAAPTTSAQQQREDFQAAEAKRTAPGARARAAAAEANPFKAFIAKHGIALDQRSEFAPGAAEQRRAMVSGYGPIFRKSGKPLDKLAQAAVEEGFLASPDETALYDLVGRALRGERIVAQYTPDAAENEMQNRVARQREMEEDAASAVADLSDAALFELNDDDIVLSTDSNTSTADFLRALGATEQEIQDAIANEPAGAQAGDQGRRGPQEADARTAQGRAGQGNGQARPGVAQDLLGDAPPSASQQQATTERARRSQQEQARRNAAPEASEFRLGMEDARTGREVDPNQGELLNGVADDPGSEYSSTDGRAQEPTQPDDGFGPATGRARGAAGERVRGDGGAVPRRTASLVGLGIADRIQQAGSQALLGQRVDSPQRLAELAQVFRDPRFETFRVFLIKDGQVVHSTGVSSRLPGETPTQPAGMTRSEYLQEFRDNMQRTGADSYYVLHNHPSGNPTPSRADIEATTNLAAHVPGMLAHVVINSNKYAVIDAKNHAGPLGDMVRYHDFGEEKLLKASKPMAILGTHIDGPEGLAIVGKSTQRPGWITLIGTGADGNVRAVSEAPASILTRSYPYLAATVRRFQRLSGSGSVFVVGEASDIASKPVRGALAAGIITDALPDAGLTLRQQGSYAGSEGFSNTKGRSVAPGTPLRTTPASGADTGTRVNETPTGYSERIGDAVKGLTVTNIKKHAGYKASDYMGLGLQFLGRRQLVDVYGSMLPQMQTYSDLMAQMDADKNEAGAGADELATAWGKLPDERQLAELMHDATRAQIDPSKPFVPGDNQTDWTSLQRRYNALSPAAKDIYARARDMYSEHSNQVRSAIKERIERSGMGGERKNALLKRMDEEFFGRIKGVYFPLARFGQYVVVVKDREGKAVNVSRAETMAEAEEARQALRTPFPASQGFTVGKVLKAKEFQADRDTVGRGFMEQLYGVLEKQGMEAKQRAELEDALGQLYLSSMPDLSWAKHGIHRKGTAGFSQDARRAFAQNVFHGARYLAKLRYSDQLQDQLTEMDKHVSARDDDPKYDSVRARQVVDEMNKRHDSAMNPTGNSLSSALTSAGFIFHLGLSPASAMVNLTQTALVAYPVMGAKWGFTKAGNALLQASKEAALNKNDITGALNADEKAAYDEAVRAGVIDVTMAHDLAGIAQGEDAKANSGPLANLSWKLRPVMKAASWMFHHAEKFNRQVTFVASYRLARQAGADQKTAYADAVKATYDGHFDYSSNNRPRVMQGNAARVLLLFKQYGQNMVYTLVRNAQQSLKGATPKERTDARKALAGLLTMHGLAAGALGLPMVTTLLAAASMIGGSDDEPWDAQVALQNMLADALGQKPAEVLAHGLSRLTPWDISGRVGLDKLIFPDVQEGLEGQRLAESAMTAALGPVAGIGVNALKGVQALGEGQYLRGLEGMLPTVLRSPMKAIRYGSEGVKDKTGIVVQDEVGAAELLGQAAGFSPSSVRTAFEGKSAIVQHDRALQARRSALVEQFAMAAMAGDEAGKTEAREAVAAFNEKNPTRRIQAMQLAQSVNQRQKRIREAQDGVYLPSKRRADAMEAGRFAVPD